MSEPSKDIEVVINGWFLVGKEKEGSNKELYTGFGLTDLGEKFIYSARRLKLKDLHVTSIKKLQGASFFLDKKVVIGIIDLSREYLTPFFVTEKQARELKELVWRNR